MRYVVFYRLPELPTDGNEPHIIPKHCTAAGLSNVVADLERRGYVVVAIAPG